MVVEVDDAGLRQLLAAILKVANNESGSEVLQITVTGADHPLRTVFVSVMCKEIKDLVVQASLQMVIRNLKK